MSEGYFVNINPNEKNKDNNYEPKNNISIIKGKDGKVEKIIGTEEDKIIINGMAKVETAKEVGPMEIMEGILDFKKEDKKWFKHQKLQLKE